MAEIMLLLVFCLLIAAAVIFKRDREVREDLNDRLTTNQAALRQVETERLRLERLVDASRQSVASAPNEIDEEWRKLVASAVMLQRIKDAGLSPEQLVQSAADIREVEPLFEKGMSGAQIASAASSATDMQAQLAVTDLARVSPAELVRLASIGLETESAGEGEHDWPPIISLSEAKGYSFAVGRAELTPDFAEELRTSIAEQVVGYIKRYDATVVEVIGHTDEQPMAPRPSNLDANLISVLGGSASVDTLVPGDNAGLGMARAVSVASALRTDPRFKSVMVLPLSGGQMILPGDEVTDGTSTGDARDRRRIEIRVRRPEAAPAQ
ncbi:hypothetical protein [Aurantimonas sp. C2-4-R8]|nr:hypothetical protein [Aurantimonas sp. C2-3-R2]